MTEEMFGPYRLVALLGRGGMGEVWRAVDTSQGDRVVALKVLGAWLGGDPDFARRFQRESALAAKLTSPNIIPIHRYGEIDGRLYIDMPLIDGSDLGALVEREGPLPPERAVWIIEQVADALDVAHRAGMVHRDVKPSNILVTGRSGREFAYLIDFGIARALDGTKISLSGVMIGTPAYMAPERFDGKGDHRADIYALGCVLHEALTGRPPFEADSLYAYLRAHHETPPPRPSTLRGSAPPELDGVVACGLAKNPSGRFDSAGALAAAARVAITATPASPAVGGPAERAAPPTILTEPADRSIVEQTLIGHTGAVYAVVTAQLDGRTVVISGGDDTAVRTWDLATGAPIGMPLTGHTRTVWATATARLDGRPVVISGSTDRTVRIWDLVAGTLLRALTGHSDAVNAVATARLDGRAVVISGSIDETVRIWDLATGKPVRAPLTGHTDAVNAVATARLDGRAVIISAGDDETVRIWDLATGKPVRAPLTGHTGTVWAVTTAQLDGRTVIVTGSIDTTVRTWDLATGESVGTPITGHTDAVNAVATARLKGRTVIVTGGVDTTVQIWDLATQEPVGQLLTDHDDVVLTVATAQLDGQPVIISGSCDGTLLTWDLAARAES